MKSWCDYDANFEVRIARYREAAHLLRGAAETMSVDQHGDLVEIAKELERLADSIAGLRSAMTEIRSRGDATGTR